VTRKITRAVARIALGLQDKFYLGNLDAQRDWGHAKDYVRMMWMILQAEQPEDWVIATGITTSVRDFARFAFLEVGITLRFEGTGVNEIGIIDSMDYEKYQKAINPNNVQQITNIEKRLEIGKEVLSIDPTYFRPTEVDLLIGDPSKAKNKLGWVPEHDLASLVKDMMQGDISLMKKEVILQKAGH
jgi:GDPmannose 4,6-dehydratase